MFGEQFHDATERDSEDRHSRAADEAADVVNPRESGARDIIMKSGSKSSYVGKKKAKRLEEVVWIKKFGEAVCIPTSAAVFSVASE